MSLILTEYLHQQITIIRKKNGPYNADDSTVLYDRVPARFVEEGESKWDGTVGGEITIGNAQAWTANPLRGVRVGDKLLYEEEVQYTIVAIRRPRDFDGNIDHVKMVLA